MTTLSPACTQAYLMFSTWRRDILAAGFSASGLPLAAYRAMDSLSRGHNQHVDLALRTAERALEEWCYSNESVRQTCEPLLRLVQEELAAEIRKPRPYTDAEYAAHNRAFCSGC